MQFIGKSKISTLHSKPDISYPLIRLPQKYTHLIGETAQIFITDYEDKKGFLILLEETGNEGKVVKQSLETNLESHLKALVLKIDEILEFIFKNRYSSIAEKPKNNGLGATRTPDLRRVKAPCTLAPKLTLHTLAVFYLTSR